MLDTAFTVDVDQRLISGLFQLSGDTTFSAPVDSTAAPVIPSQTVSAGASSTSTNLTSYINFQVRGVNNMLYKPSGDRADPSVLAGPRGTGASLNFLVDQTLKDAAAAGTPTLFTQYGITGQTVFGGSDTYDIIDTTVYIRGNASTATAQIPLRILRYAG